MTGRFAWLRRNGPAVFGVALLAGAIYVVQKEFRDLSVADIRKAMDAIPPVALWLAAGWTVLAYLVLAIYDKLGSIYAGRPVSWPKSFLASFCGYSLAHNLGFAAVSGAAVRYRLYSAWGLTPLEIAKVVGFTSLTFGLGGMALGGLVLVFEPEVVPWFGSHVPRWVLQACALPLWGIVGTYIVLSRFKQHIRVFGHQLDLPGPRMALMQTALATVDVAVTAAIFYTLLPAAEGLTFLRFLGIYLASYTAGIAAHVPGGLGVFDGAILIGLQPYMPAPEVIGALLVFRLYYYIVPLFISGALFVGFELGQRRAILDRVTALGRGSETLEVPAIASLVALAGALLIFLGALPIRGTIIEEWAGHMAALASHFAASVVGSLLLVMAYGLLRRLTMAWALTLFLLLNGAAIAWVRGEAWWLWAAFLLLAGLVAALRGAFYRDSRLVREPLSPQALVPLLAVALCGITLALVAYGGRVSDASWWEVVFSEIAPDSLRFTVGLTGVLLLIGMVRLLRPARFRPLDWDAGTRARLAALGAMAPAEADGAVLGEGEKAGFAFLRRDGVWLALGDPAGERRDAISAIWRFRDLCERAGVDPAFWRVGQDYLRVYADIGLHAVALRQEGAPCYLAMRAERDLESLRPLLPAELRRAAEPARSRAA
ncbi:lysylphosphatidylglycerol synthase domain-containing protein [Paracraurococcus ruber]|uniref:Beta-carotene 15,15'-monooxygenase n=1 Tax=Paracraurococcus ruber TaxID=77675 RepID=A0ABS1CTG1_9PROT|nr:phosphatidylglycerol lysyltransferase domain-containing protein [Paracraurococcus ruber]MBK1657633.1 beta-carotene 15,15'-monooxygenase [Paracraurococcus ruber]TDG34208.1 lysylphosphatidylglycerol synthetase family protein [Paracraurococcus ruber]